MFKIKFVKGYVSSMRARVENSDIPSQLSR